MCSSALLPFGLPPSKAPSTIGRSWVQFLLMTEWKNPIFSEDFNFFDIRPRAKCVILLFYILDFPRRKHPWRLGGHEFNSYSWQNENSEDFNFFDIWPRAKCVLLLFYILDFPLRKHPCRLGGHEFNSYSRQNEKIKFSQKISTFSSSDREQNVFYLLFYILDLPFRKHPWRLGGHDFNSYAWRNQKIKFPQKISTFSTYDRERNVFFWLFYILDIPLRKHP